jgi:hypothetical protein
VFLEKPNCIFPEFFEKIFPQNRTTVRFVRVSGEKIGVFDNRKERQSAG